MRCACVLALWNPVRILAHLCDTCAAGGEDIPIVVQFIYSHALISGARLPLELSCRVPNSGGGDVQLESPQHPQVLQLVRMCRCAYLS